MAHEIYFLTYLARSGSTLLANELDQYEQIGVTMEENLPDGIRRGDSVILKDSVELENYLDQVYEDDKFRAWNIDKNLLRERLINDLGFPLKFRDILHTIHALYFSGNIPGVIIHKQGNYCLKLDRVKEEFPGASFIFVERDPRGVFNSQIRNKRSMTGESMTTDIVTFALVYKRMQHILRSWSGEAALHVIVYENFVNNRKEELQKIVAFLGVSKSRGEQAESYYSRIPWQQKHLHNNINGKIDSLRTEGWRDELEDHKITFLQMVLKKEIKTNGYGMKPLQKLSTAKRVTIYFWWLKYVCFYFLLRLTNWGYFSLSNRRFMKFG